MTTPDAQIFYRRQLPHYQPPHATFFVTFRLAGSLPNEVIAHLRKERQEIEDKISKEPSQEEKQKLLDGDRKQYFEKFEGLLDKAPVGPKWLNKDAVAELVKEAICFRDEKDYELLSFCIMPNHVYLVFTVVRNDISLYRVLQSLKRFTARGGNKLLHRTGAFRQHESYDHVVRDGNELERTIYYVLNNPVKAGFCNEWYQWKWSYVKEDLWSG